MIFSKSGLVIFNHFPRVVSNFKPLPTSLLFSPQFAFSNLPPPPPPLPSTGYPNSPLIGSLTSPLLPLLLLPLLLLTSPLLVLSLLLLPLPSSLTPSPSPLTTSLSYYLSLSLLPLSSPLTTFSLLSSIFPSTFLSLCRCLDILNFSSTTKTRPYKQLFFLMFDIYIYIYI